MNTREAERLAALWTKAQPTVAGFVRAMIPSVDQAEDVLQEMAMICVRKFATYDPSRPFAAWAVGIARFQVFAWRRSRVSELHLLDDATVERIADSYERLSEEANAKGDTARARELRRRGIRDFGVAEKLDPLTDLSELGTTDSRQEIAVPASARAKAPALPEAT